MTSTSFAPLLSATRSRDSCWITLHAPALPRSASASASTAGGSPGCGHGRPAGSRWSRRARTASWCAARTWRSGDGGRARRRRPPRSCPSSWTRPRPRAPCGRVAAWWCLPRPSLGLRCFGGGDLALAQDRVDPGDLAPDLVEPARVVELAGHVLEPQVEVLLLRVGEGVDEAGDVELDQVGGLLVGH